VDGGVLWRNGYDGKVLRYGAGERYQQYNVPTFILTVLMIIYCTVYQSPSFKIGPRYNISITTPIASARPRKTFVSKAI
jgi:hypothetical protein